MTVWVVIARAVLLCSERPVTGAVGRVTRSEIVHARRSRVTIHWPTDQWGVGVDPQRLSLVIPSIGGDSAKFERHVSLPSAVTSWRQGTSDASRGCTGAHALAGTPPAESGSPAGRHADGTLNAPPIPRSQLGGSAVRRSSDGRTITIDSLEVVYQRPSGSGPVPGVIVLHEIAGLSEGILEVAERLVEEGYAVAAPDLYSGHPRPICIARTLLDALFGSRGTTQTRIASIRDWLVKELGGAPVAVLGFCMGGGFALMAASRQGEYQVASVNYGPVPRSRARVADLCPIVASYGGRDLIYGPQGRRLHRFLKELNRERGLHFDFQPYDSVGHGFITRPARPRRLPPLPPLYVGYNKVTADHAWGRILDFFDQHLCHP